MSEEDFPYTIDPLIENEPGLPGSWVVVECHDCSESWTVVTDEFEPALTTMDVEWMLMSELEEHWC